jgi:hypothetical protein
VEQRHVPDRKPRPGLAEALEAAIAAAPATANRWALGAGIVGAVIGAILGVIAAILRGRVADLQTSIILAALGLIVLAMGTGYLLAIVGYFAGMIFGAVRGAMTVWSVPASLPRPLPFGQNLHDHRGSVAERDGRAGQIEAVDGLGNKV